MGSMIRLLLALALSASAQVRVSVAPTALSAPAPVLAPSAASFDFSAPVPALAPSLVPAAPEKPAAPVPVPAVPAVAASPVPVRTVSALRDDADRLYASLAAIHSRAKAGEGEPALADLKRAFLGDFDGVAARLGVPETGDALRASIKALRRDRAKAEKALDAAEMPVSPAVAGAVADVSAALAARQLKAARELLAADSPVGSRAFKRNAALWALVGAHNSASAAAIEAAYVRAVSEAEPAYGDGRPYVTWNRWRNVRTELETAARDARNGRAAKASRELSALAAVLRGTGDRKDASDAAALEELAKAPESPAILAAAARVAHPAIKVRTPVAYEDMNASLRSIIHALESGRSHYLATARVEADLRRAAALISSARPAAAELDAANRLMILSQAWAGSGRVDAKREAKTNVMAARAALARGDRELAARHLVWAADGLEARLGELRRIGLSLKKRLLRALAG